MKTDTLDGGHYRPQLTPAQYWALRNKADFDATNRRCDADVARFESANAPAQQWPDDDAPAVTVRPEPFDWRGFLIGLCGLVTVLALIVAFRLLVWDALTLEGRVVLGCLAAWLVLMVFAVVDGKEI